MKAFDKFFTGIVADMAAVKQAISEIPDDADLTDEQLDLLDDIRHEAQLLSNEAEAVIEHFEGDEGTVQS